MHNVLSFKLLYATKQKCAFERLCASLQKYYYQIKTFFILQEEFFFKRLTVFNFEDFNNEFKGKGEGKGFFYSFII